jgi:hypothetical protein
VCGVFLLGKSLGCQGPRPRFGIDCDQAVLQPKQDQVGVALEFERQHDIVLVEFHSILCKFILRPVLISVVEGSELRFLFPSYALNEFRIVLPTRMRALVPTNSIPRDFPNCFHLFSWMRVPAADQKFLAATCELVQPQESL